MCAGSATSVCKVVRLTSRRSGHQMWGIGCPRSMRRGTPNALRGPPAKCPLWTAAIMCRFTVGSLTRVKFDWGGVYAVSSDRHGEADRRFLWVANFLCERNGSV